MPSNKYDTKTRRFLGVRSVLNMLKDGKTSDAIAELSAITEGTAFSLFDWPDALTESQVAQIEAIIGKAAK